MSLSKQLLILITLIFLIIFSLNFVLSMQNIRSYLEGESQIHAQDTATSLGLSLSPHMKNEHDPIIQTMMNAIFDMGYYKEMRLVDVDGKELVKLTNPVKMEGVPSWLIKLFPMKTATANSEINTGWNIAGTLSVTSNPAYGYLKLYQQFKETLKFSILVLIAAIALLIVVLRFTLKPLKDIEKQANEIATGNFTLIERMPWTLEVKNVAKSMNSMSQKIGSLISRMNVKLDSLSDSLMRDPLTQLFNQTTFNVNVKQVLSSGQHGYVTFIKIDDLGQISKDLTKSSVDKLLTELASAINNACDKPNSAYRLSGSEFALLCPSMDMTAIQQLASILQTNITQLGQSYNLNDLVHIGIVQFDRTSEFDRLSPAMIEAYEQARNIGSNAYFIKTDTISSMGEQDWKAAIIDAIENNTPEITFTAQAYNYKDGKEQKVMEEVFTVIKDDTGKPLPIGTFFSIAQEFSLAEELDKTIINKIITTLEKNQHETPVTINLSMDSVTSPGFRSWLKARIEQSLLNPALLVFSVTAYAAAKDITSFANFGLFVRELGSCTLLKRYSPDIIALDLLKDLHINYIRLARDLTSQIKDNASKPDFIDIMQEVSTLLDIKVLAEDVIDDDDFELVKQAGLYGISR